MRQETRISQLVSNRSGGILPTEGLNDLSTINVVFEGPIASTVQLIIVDSQELLPYPVKTRISKKPAFMFKLHISWKCNTVGLLVSA